MYLFLSLASGDSDLAEDREVGGTPYQAERDGFIPRALGSGVGAGFEEGRGMVRFKGWKVPSGSQEDGDPRWGGGWDTARTRAAGGQDQGSDSSIGRSGPV